MLIAEYLTTLRFDASLAAPLFRQLYDAIKNGILTGKIQPATQLPPTRALARLLGISRQTVLNAYSQLMAEGFLSGMIGKGTFISDRLPALSLNSGAAAETLPQPALRPLSSRGLRFIDFRTGVNTDDDRPKAFRIGMPGLDVFPFEIWARLDLGPADAGMHLAVAFKRKRDDVAFAQAALKKGVEVRALSQFYAAQENAPLRCGTPSGLLLGFASVPTHETRQGVATLRDLLTGY